MNGASYNGVDGFGLATATVTGTDSQSLADVANVSFVGGDVEGGLNISFGNGVIFTVESADTGMETDLGIIKSDGSETQVERGLDVVGTINGVAATGTGQLLVAANGDDSEGLRINVEGGPLGKRGSISFVRGIADQLDQVLQNLLNNNLTNKESALQTELSEIGVARVALDDRIESFRTRLEKQFLFNDILVQQLNTTQDFLKQQFEVLAAAITKK